MRTLIVEDHKLVCDGIISLLSSKEGVKVVGVSIDGLDAVKKTKNLNPDLILMDIEMPKLDGIAATKLIKKLNPNIKIIIITIHNDELTISEALESGIDAYILKETPFDLVYEVINLVIQGKELSVLRRNNFDIEGVYFKETSSRPSFKIKSVLTLREKEVLNLLSKGFLNKEIAAILNISENTVRNHLVNIFGKLNVTNRTEAIFEGRRRELVK